ncbi:MAG: GH3 auxin-responsive promoter family protein [Lachnospiraceae bacterium]|nr:GH3 auxin-responsive promoter family protein [Lachnospiraceae bacterium]
MQVNINRNDPLDKDALSEGSVYNEVLTSIINDNINTEYGKKYNFEKIKNIDDYKKNVPLIHFEDVSDEIDRMYEGEENVLTAHKVKHFLMTSGTTGKRKYIPVTYKAFSQYNNITDRINDDVVGLSGGKRLLIPIYISDIDDKPEKETFITTAYARNIYEMGFLDLDDYVGGKTMYFNSGQTKDYIYAKLYAALACEDIISIESTFLYDQLLFFSYLEKNYKKILGEMEEGRIDENICVADDIKEVLRNTGISKDRIAYIRKVCDEGFEGIGKRLWPRLHVCLGISAADFRVEEQSLRRYLGEDIPLYFYSYACSECNIGVPMETESYEYVLLPRCGFFEFRPLENTASDQDMTFTADQLEIGKSYELVITNWSGLYRYCTNDIVKVTDYYGCLPVIVFRYRRNQMISIGGEKSTTSMLQKVVSKLEEELSGSFSQFCFAADYERLPGNYLCFIEDSTEKKYDKADAASRMDRIMASLNPDYDDLRFNLKQIGAPEVCFLKPGSMVELLKKKDKLKGQIKPMQIVEGQDVAFLKKLEEK